MPRLLVLSPSGALAILLPLAACGDEPRRNAETAASGGAEAAAEIAKATAGAAGAIAGAATGRRAPQYEVAIEGMPTLTGTVMSRQPLREGVTMIHTIPQDEHGVLQISINLDSGEIYLLSAIFAATKHSCGISLTNRDKVVVTRADDRYEIRGTITCRPMQGGDSYDREVKAWLKAGK